jgi:hypothetical protein
MATSFKDVPLYPFSLKQVAAALSILCRWDFQRVSFAAPAMYASFAGNPGHALDIRANVHYFNLY